MQQLRQQKLEAQQAFSAVADRECKSEAKDKKRKCFTYSRTGTCKYGDNCKFEYSCRECAKFKAGSCAYGDACKYLRSTSIESRPEATVVAVTTKQRQLSIREVLAQTLRQISSLMFKLRTGI